MAYHSRLKLSEILEHSTATLLIVGLEPETSNYKAWTVHVACEPHVSYFNCIILVKRTCPIYVDVHVCFAAHHTLPEAAPE